MKKIINFFRLFLPIIIGGIVGIIIKNYIDYSLIEKPPLSPPKLAFPIAWSILYLLIGISYYLYRKKDYNKQLNYIILDYFLMLFGQLYFLY